MPPSGFIPIPFRLLLLSYLLSQVLNCRGSLLTWPDFICTWMWGLLYLYLQPRPLSWAPDTHCQLHPCGERPQATQCQISGAELIIYYYKPTGLSSQWKVPPATLALNWNLGHHHPSFLSLPHPVTYWLWNHLNTTYTKYRYFPIENLN